MTHALHRPRLPGQQQQTAPSFVLALLMHVLLFGGMSLVVQWRTQDPPPMVAELWSALPAPTVVAPPPPPPPPKVETPPEPPKADADIVVKQEKKAPEKKKVEAKKEEKKDDAEKLFKQLAAKEHAQREADAQKRREAEEKRILAQMNAEARPDTSRTNGRGADDPSYRARIVNCIKPHIAFAVPAGTNPQVHAQFRVELLPDGSVASTRLTKSSGLSGYDVAAENAIRRCDPFPRPRDGVFPAGGVLVDMYPVDVDR